MSTLLSPAFILLAGGLVLCLYELLTTDQLPDATAISLVIVLALGALALFQQRSPFIGTYWLGIGGAFMLLSAINFQLGAWPGEGEWWDGVPYFIAGMFAIGVASRWMKSTTVPRWVEQTPIQSPMILWSPLLAGVICLMLLAEISGIALGLTSLEISLHSQFALFLIGILLVWIGMAGINIPALNPRTLNMRTLITPYSIALIAITLFGFFLRTYQLETAIHQFVDEMNFGRAVWTWHQPDGAYQPLLAPFSSVAAFPWLYPYWQTWGVAAFGWNLTALRIVSAVIGTLTVPSLYLLAKHLFDDQRIGLIAALLLATFPPHIHFSRLGINNIADPLFGVLMLAFLTRGLKTRRQADFALAGVMMGLTQYFYEGGRVVFPLLGLIWVEVLIIVRQLKMNRKLFSFAGIFVITGIFIAAPLYYTLLARDLPLLSRFRTAGVGGSYWDVLESYDRQQTIEEQITRPLLIYVRNFDLSEFYGGNTPLLLIFITPLFLVGISYCVWRLRQPFALLLLGWVAAVTLGGMLLAEGGHAARFVVVFPALMLLVALGIQVMIPRWWPLTAAVTILLSGAQADYYFNQHIPYYNDQRRQFLDFQDAVFRATELPAGASACFVTDVPLDQIMIRNMRDYLDPTLAICYVSPAMLTNLYVEESLAMNTPHGFFLAPDDEQSQLSLRQIYGNNVTGPFLSPYKGVAEDMQYRLYIAEP